MKEIRCPMCKRNLPELRFTRNADGTRKPHCHECKKHYIMTEVILKDRLKRFRKNQDAFASRHKKYQEPETDVYELYLRMMRKTYDIKEQEIRDIMDEQRGMCACCTRSLYTRGTRHWPYLDSHGKQIRGFICSRCSVLVGYSTNNEKLLADIITYIRRYNGETL